MTSGVLKIISSFYLSAVVFIIPYHDDIAFSSRAHTSTLVTFHSVRSCGSQDLLRGGLLLHLGLAVFAAFALGAYACRAYDLLFRNRHGYMFFLFSVAIKISFR